MISRSGEIYEDLESTLQYWLKLSSIYIQTPPPWDALSRLKIDFPGIDTSESFILGDNHVSVQQRTLESLNNRET